MKNYNYYFLYTGLPIVNLRIDFENQDHVKLIKHLQKMQGSEPHSKYTLHKLRKLMRNAGLCYTHEDGTKEIAPQGEYNINIMARGAKYPVLEDNWPSPEDEDKTYHTEWIWDYNEIPLN